MTIYLREYTYKKLSLIHTNSQLLKLSGNISSVKYLCSISESFTRTNLNP
jgi:hypothetical protein